MSEEKQTGAHKRKTNGYNSTVLHQKRDSHRKDAEFRQRYHDKLSVSEKITKAESRRGDSKKEIARLTALLPVTKPVKTNPAKSVRRKVVTA